MKDLELFLNQQQREIETICKNLPNVNNSKTFVDVLRLHTRCTIKRLGLQIDLFRSFWQMILTESGNGSLYSEIFRNFGGPIPKV